MNYLSIENLTHSFGEKKLFENISFGLDKGQKLALIAKNGSGKSTLMKILNGKIVADRGKCIVRNGITLGYLEQREDFSMYASVFDAIKYKTPVFNIESELIACSNYLDVLPKHSIFSKSYNFSELLKILFSLSLKTTCYDNEIKIANKFISMILRCSLLFM